MIYFKVIDMKYSVFTNMVLTFVAFMVVRPKWYHLNFLAAIVHLGARFDIQWKVSVISSGISIVLISIYHVIFSIYLLFFHHRFPSPASSLETATIYSELPVSFFPCPNILYFNKSLIYLTASQHPVCNSKVGATLTVNYYSSELLWLSCLLQLAFSSFTSSLLSAEDRKTCKFESPTVSRVQGLTKTLGSPSPRKCMFILCLPF